MNKNLEQAKYFFSNEHDFPEVKLSDTADKVKEFITSYFLNLEEFTAEFLIQKGGIPEVVARLGLLELVEKNFLVIKKPTQYK